MLPTDPAPSPWDLHFRLFGFPVRVHPMFWLIALLLGASMGDPIALLAFILAMFVSVLIHELGHAFAMRAYGYDPEITLYAMGGYASYGAGGLFGPRSGDWTKNLFISAAGPSAEIGSAVFLCALLHAAGVQVELSFGWPYLFSFAMGGVAWPAGIAYLVYFFVLFGVFWGIINLLPIYPLDGGQIARELLLRLNPAHGMRWSLMLSFVAAGLVAVIALVEWGRYGIFTAVFFGYLAYLSYAVLAMYSGSGRW